MSERYCRSEVAEPYWDAIWGDHPPYWDEIEVVEAIRRMAGRGEPLNPQAVRKSASDVYQAAHRHCGGWAKALTMAGIDPATVYLRQMRSVKEAVDGE